MKNTQRSLFGGSAWMAALLAPLAAGAQTAPSSGTLAADDSSDQVQEVVVSGTRLQEPAGYSAPTPVTVVSSEDLQARAPANILEMVNQLPSARPTTQTAGSSRNSTNQNGIQGAVDLRGLGQSRSLTLIDGERFVPGGTTGAVDTNMVPVSLIDHIEVVTGGASAAYGSDAVAGVVNFILNDHLQGVKGNVQYGLSQFGDDKQLITSLAGGTSLFDDRAHVVFAWDHAKNQGVTSVYDRPWGQVEPSLLGTGAVGSATRPAGTPAQVWANNVEAINGTGGGIILSGPLKGTAFDPSGNPYAFNYGTAYGNNMIGSTANYGNNPQGYFAIANPFERDILYGKLTFDITEKTSAFVRLNYGDTSFSSYGAPPLNIGPLTIGINNPYLPAAVHTAMLANGLTSISLGKFLTTFGNGGNSQGYGVNRTFRFSVGAKGKIFGDWNWDAYYANGANHEAYGGPAGADAANLAAAVNATTSSTGAIVCGASTTAQAGCVPFNPFGVSSPATNAAAYNYFMKPLRTLINVRQEAGAVNLNGVPFHDWAGDVQLAAGLEARRDFLDEIPIGLTGVSPAVFIQGSQAFYYGHNNVSEGYLETGVPLAKDLGPLVKAIDLNAAIRETHYQVGGSVTTWKLGATYDIDDTWRLRATRSQDIRAATLYELFGAQTGTLQAQLHNPANGQNGSAYGAQVGNPNLTPEKAKTVTAGLVFQPRFQDNQIRASVDYFNIKISDVISTLGFQDTINGCLINHNAQNCSAITFDSSTFGISQLLSQPVNLSQLSTSGVDFEAEYRRPTLPFNIPGSLDVHLLTTFTEHMQLTVPGTGTVEYAGSATAAAAGGGVPRVRGTLTLGYDLKPVSTQFQFTGFSHILYNPTLVGPDSPAYNAAAGNSISQNMFPGVVYINWTGSYDHPVGDNADFQLYAIINNLAGRQPPAYSLNAFSFNETMYYDVVGRTYQFGVRFKF